jgi:hypothetical protein
LGEVDAQRDFDRADVSRPRWHVRCLPECDPSR